MDIGQDVRKRGVRRLAAETGLSPGLVSMIFSGKRRPSLDSALVLAATLKVSVEDLMRHTEGRRCASQMRPEAA